MFGFLKPRNKPAAVTKYNHPALGEVILRRSPRAVRVSLRVSAAGEVTLTMPAGGSEREAVRFLGQKAAWVEAARKKIAARPGARAKTILPPYSDCGRELSVVATESDRIKVTLSTGKITVALPQGINSDSEQAQAAIKAGIGAGRKREAKKLLPPRLEELADAHRFRYNSVSVRSSVTRWGSCSASDSINLSIHLMGLPPHLRDYVMLHELCHTVHKNHGERFHALLDKVTDGRHKALNKELKGYSPRL